MKIERKCTEVFIASDGSRWNTLQEAANRELVFAVDKIAEFYDRDASYGQFVANYASELLTELLRHANPSNYIVDDAK